MTRRWLIGAMLAGSITRPAAAQQAWQLPAVVRWPLLDIAVRGDSANGVILMAIPNAGAIQGFESVARSRVDVSHQEIRRWLPTAKSILDSAERLSPGAKVAPFGVTLHDTRKRYAIVLGVDPSRKPASVALLQLQDTAGVTQWSAPGSVANARLLLQVLDSAASVPGVLAPAFRSPADSPGCGETHAVLTAMPKLRAPPRSGWGGRVVLRFVVNAAGTPVDSTVQVLLTSGPPFTAEVRRAFPGVRYRPARCKDGPVASLVEQAFFMHN